MSNQRRHNFSKQWIDLPAQIKLLQSRGLVVSDARAHCAIIELKFLFRFFKNLRLVFLFQNLRRNISQLFHQYDGDYNARNDG